MKEKVGSLFSIPCSAKSRTSDKTWLYVLCAALLSFLPVLYTREFHWYDARYAFFGLVAFIALKAVSRYYLYHPVIVYTFVWLGAVMAIFLHLTIMPIFWLVGYICIVVGWFSHKTELTEYAKSKPKYTEEYIKKQEKLTKIVGPILILLGVVMIAVGPSFNF